MLLLSLFLAIVTGSSGAQGPLTSPEEQELLAVVGAARERFEIHGGPIKVFVIGPAIDQRIGTILRRELGAISPDEVPLDARYKLPPGYLLVRSLSIDGENATFSGTLGPVPAPREGVISLACGTTFNIHVTRMADRWFARVASLVLC